MVKDQPASDSAAVESQSVGRHTANHRPRNSSLAPRWSSMSTVRSNHVWYESARRARGVICGVPSLLSKKGGFVNLHSVRWLGVRALGAAYTSAAGLNDRLTAPARWAYARWHSCDCHRPRVCSVTKQPFFACLPLRFGGQGRCHCRQFDDGDLRGITRRATR